MSKIKKGILKPHGWDIITTELNQKPGSSIPEIYWTDWTIYFAGRQPTGESAFLKNLLTKDEYALLKDIFKQAGGKLAWGSGWQTDSITFGVKFSHKSEVIAKVKELEGLIPPRLALKLKVYFKSGKYVAQRDNPDFKTFMKKLKDHDRALDLIARTKK